jgi:ABC-type Zn uptake system ZnuABC Zn-binding protein ZnuA
VLRKTNGLKAVRVSIAVCLFLVACTAAREGETAETSSDPAPVEGEVEILTLPELTAVALDNAPLQVVATTSIIGDVVAQVGGEAIDLTVLIGPGQDSHSYEPGVRDLTAVADAHVIFVNGWGLEEGLLDSLANIVETGVLVPVSAGITPLLLASGDEDGHLHRADPHVWFDPQNVKQWVRNIELVLTTLDPANTTGYEANAVAYLQELDTLLDYMAEQAALIPGDGRKLVTNHAALGYLAARYDFTLIGTVLSGGSTLAEPSANDLVQLAAVMREANTCTIFAETTANKQLAEAVTAELDNCEQVQVLSLYTEAISPPGSGADSYVGMMQANIDLLVEGLK